MLERVDVDADRLHLRRRRGVGRLGLECRGRRARPFAAVALRRRARGGAEGPLEVVERDLAGLQRPLQDLVDEGTGGDLRLGLGFRRTRRGGERLEAADEVGVGAFGLGRAALELGEDLLDAVDRRQDEGDGLARHRHAVAELAHQRLGRMRQRLEARQAEKAAGALDGVDEPEDVAQDRLVVRLLLEAHELHVDNVEMLAGFGQKLAQQIVHLETRTQRYATQTACAESFARMGL